MRGLIEKDIRIMLQRKQFLLIVAVISILFVVTGNDASFIMGYMVMLMSIYSLSTISYDEHDNCMQFLMTLPISRRDYATSKYILCPIVGLASWLVGIILVAISYVIKNDMMTFISEIPLYFVYILICALLLAINIPLHIKYGGEKVRTIMFIMVGIGVLLGWLIDKVGAIKPGSFQVFETMLDSTSNVIIAAVIVFISAIIMIVSYIFSVGIAEKKEF